VATGQKFTNLGQALVTKQLDKNNAVAGGSLAYHGAWGSNGTTPAVTDTVSDFTQHPEARVSIAAGSMSRQTTQSTNDTIRWQYTITATGNRTVQETGIFDIITSGSGELYIRIVHGSLALESGDQVAYTVNLQFTDVSGS
jgi:hypothetical protein